MTSSVMHADAALVRLVDEAIEVLERAVARMDALVVGDVVAVVAQRRRVEGQQPERVDAEALQVVELLGQAGEVADAVAVAVEEGADVRLVDDGVLVPERITSLTIGGLATEREDVRDPRRADRGGRSSTRRATCRSRPTSRSRASIGAVGRQLPARPAAA